METNAAYNLQDGFGFRLLNEDEILTGEAFPLHPVCIFNIAKKLPVIHNCAPRQRAPKRHQLNRRPEYNSISMPQPLNSTSNGKEITLIDYAIWVACFSLFALVMFLTVHSLMELME